MKTVYIILGMHRSGTSALGGVLNEMGLNFGSYLMEKNEYNPKGYFENNYVYLLNKKILEDHGMSWDNYTFNYSNILQDKKKSYIDEAKEIINKEFKYAEQFVIKDPRMCLVLPLWEQAFLELGIEINIIISYRNPMEVAGSLKKRNGFSYEKSLILWLHHFLHSELYSRKHKRIFLSFEDLLEDTQPALEKLTSFTGIKLTDKIKKKVGSFLDSNLKHNSFSISNFIQQTPMFLQKFIGVLQSGQFENNDELDNIRSDFEFTKELFNHKEINNQVLKLENQKNLLSVEIEQISQEYNNKISDSSKLLEVERENLKVQKDKTAKTNSLLETEKEKLRLQEDKTNKLLITETEIVSLYKNKNFEINALLETEKKNSKIQKNNLIELESQLKQLKENFNRMENVHMEHITTLKKSIIASEGIIHKVNEENRQIETRFAKSRDTLKSQINGSLKLENENKFSLNKLNKKLKRVKLKKKNQQHAFKKTLSQKQNQINNFQSSHRSLNATLKNTQTLLIDRQKENNLLNVKLNKQNDRNKNLYEEFKHLKLLNYSLEKKQNNFKHNLKYIRQYIYQHINARIEIILSNIDQYQTNSLTKFFVSKKGLSYFLNQQFLILNDVLRIQQKHNRLPIEFIELFEQDQYLEQNTDVKAAVLNTSINNAIEHFINFGYDEIESGGRYLYTNTNLFSNTKTIASKQKLSLKFDAFLSINHLESEVHNTNTETKSLPLITINGLQKNNKHAKSVLICAHIAGKYLFGSERSFLDMVKAASQNGYNVLVTIPQKQQSYIDILSPYVSKVIIFKYGWWRKELKINNNVILTYENIIKDNAIDLVHANTIMLREPLIAAKLQAIKSIVHVRELIEGDEALINLIGEEPQNIVKAIYHSSNVVLANSNTTAKLFNKLKNDTNKITVIHNTVNINNFDFDNIIGGKIKIGLISSNIPKKGIFDFVEVAKKCQHNTSLLFLLIGPDTVHTEKLLAQQKQGEIPNNIIFSGYKSTAMEAVKAVNIVVNISNFTESFGRTVIEGMAAGRPVVAYKWGAVAELIDDGIDGYLTEYRDTTAIAEKILLLTSSKQNIIKMGLAGKIKAQIFSHENYKKKMSALYQQTLSITTKIEVIKPIKIAYFLWHFPVPSETFVLNELRQLVKKGFDVIVYCKQSPYKDFNPDFDIQWKRISSADDLAFVLKNDNREIVHSHFVYPTVTDMVWPACEKAQIPFTFIAHAQDIFRYTNDEKNKIGEISKSKFCSKIFVPSRFHLHYLMDRKVAANKMVINPNGINPQLYNNEWLESVALRNKKSICTIHRFTEKKGLENLIIAAGKLGQKIQVHIYGYGELEDTYKQLIKQNKSNNVFLHGSVKNRQEMLKVFGRHDFFACPSVRAKDGDMDGIPTVLMEAMAAGIPVLSTALSGIPDLIIDEITGIITDPTVDSIVKNIQRYYELPTSKVSAIIDNAQKHIERNYNTLNLVSNLLRVWNKKTVDLIIVSWNNLPELKEVIRRLLKYTSLPSRLIICDNNSKSDVKDYLTNLNKSFKRVTIIFNPENSMVGPGTNIALKQSTSDYAIYVCGKEGFVFNYGWEQPLIKFMEENDKVGLAGSLGYSPSYLKGKDYAKGISEFPRFRNKDFAAQNPERIFKHVQGGFFILRKKMYAEIGGFNDLVPHNYTDVEYSYYVESCDWKLGHIPQMLALYNKTLPGIFSRIDESMTAIHPPMLSDLKLLDQIAQTKITFCNICQWHGNKFKLKSTHKQCPQCDSIEPDRTLYRYLAESILTHRRLPALAINLNASIKSFWVNQFQGRCLSETALFEEVKKTGKIDHANNRLQLAYINLTEFSNDYDWKNILIEIKRVLKSDSELIVQYKNDKDNDNISFTKTLNELGFHHEQSIRYSSTVVNYDWKDLIIFKNK